MRVDASFKYLKKSEFTKNVLDKNIKKIERRVKIFKKDDPIHVSVHMEKNPHKEEYYCRSHVYLPGKLIKAEESGKTFSVATNKTFSALNKQLDKVKYKVENLRSKKLSKNLQRKAEQEYD